MRNTEAGARDISGFGSTFAVFAGLTLLVWGLFAVDRGLWQDDTLMLSWVGSHGHGLRRLFQPVGSPTRVLAAIPFAIAWATSRPVITLQLIYGAVWMSSGILPLRDTVILTYVADENRFVLDSVVPKEFRTGKRFSEQLYQPFARVLANQGMTEAARRVLEGPQFLARMLPGAPR